MQNKNNFLILIATSTMVLLHGIIFMVLLHKQNCFLLGTTPQDTSDCCRFVSSSYGTTPQTRHPPWYYSMGIHSTTLWASIVLLYGKLLLDSIGLDNNDIRTILNKSIKILSTYVQFVDNIDNHSDVASALKSAFLFCSMK